MPMFDFQCKRCKKVVEKICKNSDPAPKCECGRKMKRLFSTPSFHFKNGAGTNLGLLWSIPKKNISS